MLPLLLTACTTSPCPQWYDDADGDGFGGQFSATVQSCAVVDGQVTVGGDCDDTNPGRNPDAPEACNGVDDNCDGVVDPDRDPLYVDADLDGYGVGEVVDHVCAGFAPPAFANQAGDCDDGDSSVHPGAAESCNDVDDDCDGAVDNGSRAGRGAAIVWFDADGDGQGSPTAWKVVCGSEAGWVPNFSDCDDADPARYDGSPRRACRPRWGCSPTGSRASRKPTT